jgi:hypothetical protein
MYGNLEFVLGRMGPALSGYLPDLAGLRAASTRTVVAVGDDSRGQVAYQAAVALAGRLGTEVVVFPGDHAGFVTHADAFAARLDEVLRG